MEESSDKKTSTYKKRKNVSAMKKYYNSPEQQTRLKERIEKYRLQMNDIQTKINELLPYVLEKSET